MSEFVDEFLAEYGEPRASQPMEIDGGFDARVPSPLRHLWHDYGASSWLDGRFQIVNFERYKGVVELWRQTLQLDDGQALLPFFVDCFGGVKVWQLGVGGSFTYMPEFHALLLDKNFHSKGQPEKQQEFEMESKLFGFDPSRTDGSLALFSAARTAFGDLALDEIYAPKLALPMGGKLELENLQRISAPDYLQMVTELEPPRVMTTDDLARIAFGADGPEALQAAMKNVH